jgi:hypothetical protein
MIAAIRVAYAAALVLTGASASAADAVHAARFSDRAPGSAVGSEWREVTPKSSAPRTLFSIVQEDGRTVLRMEANRAVAALSRTLRIEPRSTSILTWEWKVTRLLDRSDIGAKSGDDFPARIYVFFDYDPSKLPLGQRAKLAVARALHGDAVPLAARCYVWDTRAPVGTIAPNAYTDRVRMIVVESGAKRLGQWIAVERNVIEDYRAAFGEEAPAITGIALAADTDDTGEQALSFIADVLFRDRSTSR